MVHYLRNTIKRLAHVVFIALSNKEKSTIPSPPSFLLFVIVFFFFSFRFLYFHIKLSIRSLTSAVKPHGVSSTLQMKVSLEIARLLTMLILPRPRENQPMLRDTANRISSLHVSLSVWFYSIRNIIERVTKY